MNIEAVEDAKIPTGMASKGGNGGFLGGSGKMLSGIWDVPEDFAIQPAWGNRTKVTAVCAIEMSSNDKELAGQGVNILDLFDHCTVNRMFENDDITRSDRTQQIRDVGDDQVISLIIFGFQTVPGDFDQLEHRLQYK